MRTRARFAAGLLCGTVMLGCSLAASPALAQSGSMPAATDASSATTQAAPQDTTLQTGPEPSRPILPANGSSDIVVTARLRSETLISVPVVVSVLTSQRLVRNMATDFTSIGELAPTAIVGNYKPASGGSIAIRRISTPANSSGIEQAVSAALDGVQFSDGRIAQLGFLDFDQAEVLKGPQALFFGKNNTARVMSLKAADPADKAEVQLRGGYEFVGGEYTLEGAGSLPILAALSARLAVRYRSLDGWLRNTA